MQELVYCSYSAKELNLEYQLRTHIMNRQVPRIFSQAEPPIFSLEGVRPVIQVLCGLTSVVAERVRRIDQIRAGLIHDPKADQELVLEAKKIVESWEIKVRKLGGVPRGLWLADFDSGDGYYCWKFPETKLIHWHAYDQGFSNRRCLESPVLSSPTP